MSLTLMTSTERYAAVTALKATLEKQGELLMALEALDTSFGGLTEAQQNTWANAEHKHDEAASALCKLGVMAFSWEAISRMYDK